MDDKNKTTEAVKDFQYRHNKWREQ